MQQFGGVPLIKERVSGILESVERSSTLDTYDYIISELKSIANSDDLVSEATDGTFNKRAANHYLAKAYLSRGYISNNNQDFLDAITAADAAGAGQPLTTDYSTLFSNAGEGNNEVLFSVVYDLTTVEDKESGNKQQAHFGAYLNGQSDGHKYTSSTLVPTLWMHEVFNTNTNNASQDERYEATFMMELRESYWDYYDETKKNTSKVQYYYCPSWELDNVDTWRSELSSRAEAKVIGLKEEGLNYAGTNTTYVSKMRSDIFGLPCFRKFDDIENGKDVFSTTSSMRDIYLARLAETNLIAAEACIKTDNLSGALRYVNIVRTRANATSAQESEMNIDYILNERARELAGENHRWADLVRTGKLAEYVEKYNPDISEGQITDKFYLRPIPLSAIELNPALKDHQNEGW